MNRKQTQLHTMNFRIKNTCKNLKDKSIQSLWKMTYLFFAEYYCLYLCSGSSLQELGNKADDSHVYWGRTSLCLVSCWWVLCVLLDPFCVFGSFMCWWFHCVLAVLLSADGSSMCWWFLDMLTVPQFADDFYPC